MADVQPLSSSPTTTAASGAAAAGSSDASQSADKVSAFQAALSHALNAPQTLADAGGTDDDDDGTSLKIQMSGGIPVP